MIIGCVEDIQNLVQEAKLSPAVANDSSSAVYQENRWFMLNYAHCLRCVPHYSFSWWSIAIYLCQIVTNLMFFFQPWSQKKPTSQPQRSCSGTKTNESIAFSVPEQVKIETEMYRSLCGLVPSGQDPAAWWWGKQDGLPIFFAFSNTCCVEQSPRHHLKGHSPLQDMQLVRRGVVFCYCFMFSFLYSFESITSAIFGHLHWFKGNDLAPVPEKNPWKIPRYLILIPTQTIWNHGYILKWWTMEQWFVISHCDRKWTLRTNAI